MVSMDTTRPWWRGLDSEVRQALAGWVPARDERLERLEARLRERLPCAECFRPEGADLAVAWDGVGGRSEVRLLVESSLVREADLPRVLLRVLLQRGEGRAVVVALHGGCAPDLVRALEVSLEGEDPVLGGEALVVDLRARNAATRACAGDSLQRGSGSRSSARSASG